MIISSKERPLDVTFRDLILIIALLFVIMFSVVIVFVSKAQKESSSTSVKKTMMIELMWPDRLKSDIDIHIKTPDDKKTVGYYRRVGNSFSLLKDDTGFNEGDIIERNYEVALAEYLIQGKYIINVVWYADKDMGVEEIPVIIIISASQQRSQNLEFIWKKKIIIKRQGKQITVTSFNIIKDKYNKLKIDMNSFNSLPVSLSIPPAALNSGGSMP